MRGVRVDAATALAVTPAATLSPEALAARSRALAEVRAVQALDADQPSAHVNLALLELAQGDALRAERHYRRALDVGDFFVPAYVNLADLYRAQERDTEGVALLEAGLAIVPASADLHHSLGLALVRLDRSDEALAPLRRASELGANPRFAYVYGVALDSVGRTAAALEALEAARVRFPDYAPIGEALASLRSR